jgi:menaquinone-9 beta-reductase
VDVLVAGAGPAGSATAALLARAGLSVLAVDRAAFPREKACSEYMSPETVRILSRLGVLPALERAGGFPIEGLRVTASGKAAAHGKFALGTHAPFRASGLSVSRRILDHELVEAARVAGAEVAEQTYLEELLYDRGAIRGAVVRERGGRRHPIQARLTVGADGLRSLVARRLGGRTYGRPRRVAFVAHVEGVRGMGSSAELHFDLAGYVGLNPIGQGRTNVGVVVPARHAEQARGRLERFFFDVVGRFPGIRERVEPGEIVRPVLATGPFAVRAGRVVAPGALLVGDAADFFDPFTGDGIYSALRGAELVADSMTPALSGENVMDGLVRYRRARRQAFAGKWVLERLLGYAMHFPRLFERGVERLGRHEEMAHTLIGVAGGFAPAREVLNPMFLARMVF